MQGRDRRPAEESTEIYQTGCGGRASPDEAVTREAGAPS